MAASTASRGTEKTRSRLLPLTTHLFSRLSTMNWTSVFIVAYFLIIRDVNANPSKGFLRIHRLPSIHSAVWVVEMTGSHRHTHTAPAATQRVCAVTCSDCYRCDSGRSAAPRGGAGGLERRRGLSSGRDPATRCRTRSRPLLPRARCAQGRGTLPLQAAFPDLTFKALQRVAGCALRDEA
jgi:hypothetical protein